ncbi:MAG TPA: hypothetical protein VGK46_12275 [Saprospiraceae bacterium]|jgi:hypothetical protein
MKDFRGNVRFLITSLLVKVIMLAGAAWPSSALIGQTPDPATSIKELKEGTLIVRFPTNKAKIDTLTAMAKRTSNPDNKQRLEKELQQTIGERDTLVAHYVEGFKLKYDFSKVAYYFDYDGRDLNTARYYNLDGEHIAIADLSEKPIFYLFFDRSEEMKMDALTINSRMLKKIPKPFPNDFTTGGLNYFFVSLSNNTFESWRIKKMNKRFHMFWNDVMAYEKSKEKG